MILIRTPIYAHLIGVNCPVGVSLNIHVHTMCGYEQESVRLWHSSTMPRLRPLARSENVAADIGWDHLNENVHHIRCRGRFWQTVEGTAQRTLQVPQNFLDHLMFFACQSSVNPVTNKDDETLVDQWANEFTLWARAGNVEKAAELMDRSTRRLGRSHKQYVAAQVGGAMGGFFDGSLLCLLAHPNEHARVDNAMKSMAKRILHNGFDEIGGPIVLYSERCSRCIDSSEID